MGAPACQSSPELLSNFVSLDSTAKEHGVHGRVFFVFLKHPEWKSRERPRGSWGALDTLGAERVGGKRDVGAGAWA